MHEAYFSLGNHGKEGISTLHPLKNTLDSYLNNNQTGRVYVFLESANLNEFHARAVSLLVDKGLTAMKAFAVVDYVAENEEVPLPEQLEGNFKKWKRRNGAFWVRELELISDVQERHYDPIKYPVPRVGVVMENRPDHELEEVEKQKKRRKRLSKKAMSLVDQGMLDEGLVPFKEEVVSFTAECIARKSRLVGQIDEVLQKPDALAVVSILGPAHTPEAYEIRARGYKTSVEIRGREGHTYWFDSYSALIRHCVQFGTESLSPLDWYRGMIGSRMNFLFVQMAG